MVLSQKAVSFHFAFKGALTSKRDVKGTDNIIIKMIQVQRGRDSSSVPAVLTLSHAPLKGHSAGGGERDPERNLAGALHALIRYCAAWRFMKKSERPGELQLEPLNAWNFSALRDIFLSCVSDLQSPGQLKSLHVGRPRQHHTPVPALISAR